MIQTIILYSLGILALLFLIWKLPKWQTKKIEEIDKKEKWKAENEFRKTLLQVFGGLVVIVGLYFAYQEIRNFHISQENMKAGQIASRFSQAIELLSKKEDTTSIIGGIYALEQIAKESPKNYLGTVIEVLSTFVRNVKVISKPKDFETWKTQYAPNDRGVQRLYKEIKSGIIFSMDDVKRWLKEQDDKNEELNKLFEKFYIIKPETQIAMTVLGRIRTHENNKYWENLPRVNLVGAKLREAKLTFANLTNADLPRADLSYADLSEADLSEANLTEANLLEAQLTGANLHKANLNEARLEEADLQESDLTRANLFDADLKGSNLWRAKLKKADLSFVDLSWAFLQESDLTGAYIIRRANLTGANLKDAKGLKVEQLLKSISLWKIKGLPPEMEKEIREKEPELFEKPLWLELFEQEEKK